MIKEKTQIPAKCLCCDEVVGLVGDEIEHFPVVHGGEIGSFFCHVCRCGWTIYANYVPMPDYEE